MQLQAAERKLQIAIQKALTKARQVTMSTSETANTPSFAARLGLANWRQNIIYIGFVVIFLVFAVDARTIRASSIPTTCSTSSARRR